MHEEALAQYISDWDRTSPIGREHAGNRSFIGDDGPKKAVVLVHGGFVDGSGWEGVYQILKRDGFDVSVVQNPTLSLAGDVTATKLVIDAQSQPVILVGHSYGGVVITEAGNDPKVVGLVYIAAFAPDASECATLIATPPPGATVPPILPPNNGFLFLDKEKFPRFLCCRR